MKKYYILFLITLLGTFFLNNQIKINLQDKNVRTKKIIIIDITINQYNSGMVIDSDLYGNIIDLSFEGNYSDIYYSYWLWWIN